MDLVGLVFPKCVIYDLMIPSLRISRSALLWLSAPYSHPIPFTGGASFAAPPHIRKRARDPSDNLFAHPSVSHIETFCRRDALSQLLRV